MTIEDYKFAGKKAIVSLREAATDDSAVAAVYVFPEWKAETEYTAGERLRYGEKLYKVLVDHTSTEGYTPDITNYQYVEITDPSVEYPEWVQPLGYADAYAEGAKVTHSGKKWVSTVDNNTWEPGVYGWEEVQ